MTGLNPDHLHLLALARRALEANSGPLRKTDSEEAIQRHGAACDALWGELQRQVNLQDGNVPILEHPCVKHIWLATQMRATILAACRGAIKQALDEVSLEG